MFNKRTVLIFLILTVVLTACNSKTEKTNNEKDVSLTVSAAASLNEVITELKTIYENNHPNIEILLNISGSGSLKQQIIQGAPVDLFFSASEDHFNSLVQEQLIDEKYHSNIIGNSLVLIQQSNSEKEIDSLNDLTQNSISKIALGTPETVPAGNYGKQTLLSTNLWDQVEPKIIPAKDVRHVLTYVETGNVDAGFVYKTDALQSDKVLIVSEVPVVHHEPIVYPAGVITKTKNYDDIVQFYQFLKTEAAEKIFKKYGFLVLE